MTSDYKDYRVSIQKGQDHLILDNKIQSIDTKFTKLYQVFIDVSKILRWPSQLLGVRHKLA